VGWREVSSREEGGEWGEGRGDEGGRFGEKCNDDVS